MRLLQYISTNVFNLVEPLADSGVIPPYAILSHTWIEGEEVTYEELVAGTGRSKAGYAKIQFCAEQARRDGLKHFWVDTCCINKANLNELSQAINSMFRWYRNASRCYVHLSDVHSIASGTGCVAFARSWDSEFRKSRWFTRGWTLQELLASQSVQFFSHGGQQLGDKESLKLEIREITGLPLSALEGTPLSQFCDEDRLKWMGARETMKPEDKVYSLLGILDAEMSLEYGEGMVKAKERLREILKKRERCISDLRPTDPRDDKKRIEETKGGLLRDSYYWILENAEYQQWRSEVGQDHVLWVKGDPGKGKTMLLCGVINELSASLAKTDLVSYFFCQATDARINNAIAVLRGLLYMLVSQQPSLASHIQKKYDHAGQGLFKDTNAWVALSEITTNVLQDPRLGRTYLVIDALDECVTELPKLLQFITEQSACSPHVKWIVSSRNWPAIEEGLEAAKHKARLCLELNPKAISTAVATFIRIKVSGFAQRKKYSKATQDAIVDRLTRGADNTFLWVALVCQSLEGTTPLNALKTLNMIPPGLNALYGRMLEQIKGSDSADVCMRGLAVMATVYRPVSLDELTSLIDMPEEMSEPLDYISMREIIGLCASFLIIRDNVVYFVHQSAKDYLVKDALVTLFPSGQGQVHRAILSKCLRVLSGTLKRDIYNLSTLGYPIEQVKQPDPDPFAASRYACIYWVDHLCDWNYNSRVQESGDLQDGGTVEVFIREKYLYWLEALSLCRSMSAGVLSMAKFEASLSVSLGSAGSIHNKS
jgi:hypothetical protein